MYFWQQFEARHFEFKIEWPKKKITNEEPKKKTQQQQQRIVCSMHNRN